MWLFFWNSSHATAFISVETAALTFRVKQYSTSYSSHICYGKRFCNDFFLDHNTTALVHKCFKITQLYGHLDFFGWSNKRILTVSFQLENVPFSINSYRFVCNDCPGGDFHIRRSGGLAPTFASEILVGAPNFASKNLDDKYPKFCPLNFRFDPKIGDFPQLLRLVTTELPKFFLLLGELDRILPQILPLNLMSGPSPPPHLLIWKYPPGNDCNACSQTIMTHHFAFGYLRKG